MKKLEECNWKAFCIDDIFTIDSGVRLTKGNQKSGNRPFIGSTDSNNGITEFVSNTNKSLDRNVLGVNYNGSVVENFYHPYEAIFSDDVKRLHLKHYDDNKFVLLFIKSTILKQKVKYQYGYKFNEEHMKRQYIMLPAVSEEEPDYAFMEEYMREVEKRQKEKYKAYVQKRIEELGDTEKLENKEWKAFFIEKVCEIESGQDIYQTERTFGFTPYITATAEQNGIGYFVGNNNDTLEEDCISVNRNGSVGYAFYHPYKALYGNDTRKLRPRVQNKYASIFISLAITQQKEKYGYGLKMGTGRLKRQYIMLPINSEGEPDYVFMENYMKRKEMEMLKRYVGRIER